MTDTSQQEIVVTGKRRQSVGNQHPIVRLKVGGKLHSEWKEIDIQRSIETMCNGFSLVMSAVDPAAGKIVQIAPGEACELLMNDETVVTGYIDESGPQFDADRHEVRIAGRDRTGDMVDSAAYVPTVNPGIWAKGQKVLQIIAQIAQPFEITVKEEVDAGAANIFALQPGETAFTAVDRICKEAAVLPVSDGQGGIVLTRGGLGPRFAALVEGKNILSAEGRISWRDRFSHYYVFVDSAGAYVPLTPQANVGIAIDPDVKRWRPTFITADFKGFNVDKLNAYANWVMTVHAAKSYRPTVVSQGWQDDTGLLWQPNGMVPVTSAKLGIDESLLIVSTRFKYDEEGTRTELALTRPDAFKLIPLESGPDIIIPGAGTRS